MINFLKKRPRRLRYNATLRGMVKETTLQPNQLIYPLFIKEGITEKIPVDSMPGIFQLSIKDAVSEAEDCWRRGIRSVILFGIPAKKDSQASGAYDKNGIIQQAIRAIKDKCSDIVVTTDVCLCEYMDHGHCGVVRESRVTSHESRVTGHWSLEARNKRRATSDVIDNDASVELIAKTALSHVEAGADLVAPSDMMDGRVRAIRQVLDQSGHVRIPIMSYAVKFASSFYGPFRDAAESPPQFGDRQSYQMDFANVRDALKEAKLDEEEGADIILIKPALPYLDIISRVSSQTNLPVAAYQVSGEYSMIVSACEKGWLDRKGIVAESLLAIRRAGAQLIITYFAKEAIDYLK